MAVAATIETSRYDLGFEAPDSNVWLAAHEIPELNHTIQAADAESARIYESHMAGLRIGEYAAIPLDSDAISSADRVLAAEQVYGTGSHQHEAALTGLYTNCQRYLAETWSKLGPEYFGKLEHVYDHDQQDYLSFNTPITPMIHRGITPLAEAEEVPRRFMENRENRVNNRVGELAMKAAGLVMVDASVPELALPMELRKGPLSSQTISECPDHIIERYDRDSAAGLKRSYGGYAPQIKKLMLRDTSYEAKGSRRYVEQLSVSGEYITHEVVLCYLERKGAIPEGARPDKTDILGLQVLTNDDGGVLAMARELDVIASQVSGQTVFLGEAVAADHPRDYEAFPAEAAARQAKQIADAQELTRYSLELAINDIEPAIANKLIDELVERQMFAAAKLDITMAEVAFDKETADALRGMQAADNRGDFAKARELEERARKIAPPPEGCSGSACEIKTIDAKSDEGQELAKLLRAKPGDKIAKDESAGRRCKCGGQLAYAYTLNRVNTACTACGAFKSKNTSVKKD